MFYLKYKIYQFFNESSFTCNWFAHKNPIVRGCQTIESIIGFLKIYALIRTHGFRVVHQNFLLQHGFPFVHQDCLTYVINFISSVITLKYFQDNFEMNNNEKINMALQSHVLIAGRKEISCQLNHSQCRRD